MGHNTGLWEYLQQGGRLSNIMQCHFTTNYIETLNLKPETVGNKSKTLGPKTIVENFETTNLKKKRKRWLTNRGP